MSEINDIFASQYKLNRKLVPNLDDEFSTEEGRTKWILNYKLAMDQEIAEMVDCLNWKWWKKQELDKQNLKVELVDILFFWVSMCQAAGLSARDMMSAYFQKLEINHERADKGYAKGTYNKVDENGEEDNRRIK